ncbi:MAG: transcription elongation factor GreA [bacterium]
MPAEKIILTPQGYEKIQKTLDDAKKNDRPRIQEALRETRAHGDLRENAGYDEAMINQGRLEAKIRDLEYILDCAQIEERPDNAHEEASLGSNVTVFDTKFGEEWTFTLVGSFEADPTLDHISIVSPVGKAIIGHKVGDTVKVETPGGIQEYEIRGLS